MSPGHVIRWLVVACLLPYLAACAGAPAPPPGSRRLVIVAVDGATWRVISPLMEQGRMPRLASLYRAGSAGLLKSLEPMLPDALWTTVATGKSRGAHAIESATEKVPGKYAARPITADRRRSPALWTIAGARGLTVGVSGWAVTFPAEHVNGYMIADGFDPTVTTEHGYLYPEGALGEGARMGEALGMSSSAEAIAALDDILRASFTEDLAALSRGVALYRVYQPRLALFRFTSIDLASHRFWQYYETRYLELAAARGHTVDAAAAARLAGALPGACEFFDEWLGLLLERLPEKSTLLILSDHGFRGVTLTDYLHIDLNRLLSRLGYLAITGEGALDWSHTKAFSLDDLGGQRRGVFLNVRNREAHGIVDEAAAAALAQRVGDSLRDLKSQTGEPIFRTVAISDTPASGEPEISVIENLGIDPRSTIHIRTETVPVTVLYKRYGEDFGAHDPAGILVAAGEGIAAGRMGWSADLYDILPTVLTLMGLPIASDMPGHPLADILIGQKSQGYPIVPTYNDLQPAPAPARRPPGAAQQEMRRLRALGHLR